MRIVDKFKVEAKERDNNTCRICGTRYEAPEDKKYLCVATYLPGSLGNVSPSPDNLKYAVTQCRSCSSLDVRRKTSLERNLINKGMSAERIREVFVARWDEIFEEDLDDYNPRMEEVTKKYIAFDYSKLNEMDDDPFGEAPPGLSLEEERRYMKRLWDFKNDFLFNKSSDAVLVRNVILDEILLARMYAELLKLPVEGNSAARKEYNMMIKDASDRYNKNLDALSISRKQSGRLDSGGIVDKVKYYDSMVKDGTIEALRVEEAEQLTKKEERDNRTEGEVIRELKKKFDLEY